MFNGLALVRELRKHGHEVWIVNRGQTEADLPAGVQRLYCDRTDHAKLRQTFDGLKGDRPLRMDLTGPSVFATATSERINAEMKVLTGISVAAVLILMFAAFRSVSLLLVLLLPLGFGICAGAAATQLTYGYLHGVTLAFGGTLIGVAVDYPVHLIGHATLGGKTRA